jgi:hypothetical protein
MSLKVGNMLYKQLLLETLYFFLATAFYFRENLCHGADISKKNRCPDPFPADTGA